MQLLVSATPTNPVLWQDILSPASTTKWPFPSLDVEAHQNVRTDLLPPAGLWATLLFCTAKGLPASPPVLPNKPGKTSGGQTEHKCTCKPPNRLIPSRHLENSLAETVATEVFFSFLQKFLEGSRDSVGCCGCWAKASCRFTPSCASTL